jgi:hypothetical protein
LHPAPETADGRDAVLDAYIIEEIKRQEEARRRAESDARPRLQIERLPVEPPAPETPAEEDEHDGPIRIDIDDAIPIRPPSVA